jgi:glycosyltransferase involved in cell wall biosynthesis
MGRLPLPPNVVFEGFVSSERLDELHRICDLFICPVTLGSGIKIKVLEATGYGLPVAATRESLAGIDYLGDAVCRIHRDPKRAALVVAALLADPRQLEAMSARASAGLEAAHALRSPLVVIPAAASTNLPCAA